MTPGRIDRHGALPDQQLTDPVQHQDRLLLGALRLSRSAWWGGPPPRRSPRRPPHRSCWSSRTGGRIAVGPTGPHGQVPEVPAPSDERSHMLPCRPGRAADPQKTAPAWPASTSSAAQATLHYPLREPENRALPNPNQSSYLRHGGVRTIRVNWLEPPGKVP